MARRNWALARFDTSGNLDSSFGGGGVVVFPSSFPAIGVAIQSDGKIVTATIKGLNLAVLRYNSNGTLDATFGSGGIVSTLAAGRLFGPLPGGVALLPSGKILVTADRVALRLLGNGQLDSTFGSGGVAQLLSGAQSLALLSHGKALVASAFAFTAGVAARYNSAGSPDQSFGANGQAAGLGRASAIATMSDDSFIVAGTLNSPVAPLGSQAFALTRYNADGTINTTFGTHGTAVTTFPGNGFSAALAVAVQSNGDIVAAGVTEARNPGLGQEPSDFALARYTPTGQLDTTFGNNGRVTTSFGTNGDTAASASALAIQSDGKIVVVGSANFLTFGSPGNGFALARYLVQ